ncbi:MAG: hypothetical protein AB1626_03675 [Candidatus Micrarchaeota archaeon]
MGSLDVLTKPEETLAAGKKNASMAKGAVPYSVLGVATGLPLGAVMALTRRTCTLWR